MSEVVTISPKQIEPGLQAAPMPEAPVTTLLPKNYRFTLTPRGLELSATVTTAAVAQDIIDIVTALKDFLPE